MTLNKGEKSGLRNRMIVMLSLVIVMAVYAVPNTVAQQTVTEEDSLALLALYTETDGDNWNDNSGWLVDSAEEWYGVGISEERVVMLDFEGNNLTGELPSEIADLTMLEHVNMRDNNISGEIPSELAGLLNLRYMNFRDNDITGEVSGLLNIWDNMNHVDLRGNHLEGELPSGIGDLDSLEALILRENDITGVIPPELGNLVNMNRLELGENELNGEIPSELSNLVNLERLELDEQGGPLIGTIPAWIGDLEKLERLRLHRNNFTGEIPAELGNLTNLERIDLQRNSLTGEIPEELGQLAPTLERLSLGENEFTSGEIPGWIEGMENLQRLELEETNRTGEVPEWIGNLTGLTRLFFDGNTDLTGPLPMSLVNLENMSRFNFEDTGLCEPDNEEFRAWLDGIDRLGTSGLVCDPVVEGVIVEQDSLALADFYNETGGDNWENSTGWLEDNPDQWYGIVIEDERIVRLELEANNLSGQLPASISNLEKLEVLDLRENDLSGEIPSVVSDLLHLDQLLLGENNFTGNIPSELSDLRLNKLDLKRNSLEGDIPEEMAHMTALEHLSLMDNNFIPGEIPGWMENLFNLKHLELAGTNRTGEIPVWMGNLSHLKNLDLADNNFEGELPREIGDLSRLKRLYVNANTNLNGSIPMSFTNLEALEGFFFEDTGLCKPDDDDFQAWLDGVEEVAGTGEVCPPVSADEDTAVPEVVALDQNYPNPFNPTTTISYDIPEVADVRLEVFNPLGQHVTTLVNERKTAGSYEVRLDSEDEGLASGSYIYRLSVGNEVITRTMTVVR